MTRGVRIRRDRVFLDRDRDRTVPVMDVLILNRAEVEELLDLRTLLAALRDGFEALTAGEVTAPGRNELAMPDEAFLLGMPGRLRDGIMTVKVVTVFEGHDPSHLATIGLYDPATGACKAFIDGTYITAIRTSAAAAVATDLLARRDARTLAIIGGGVQGEHHLRTFPLVRDFEEIRVSSLYRADAERVAELHPRAHVVDDPEAAVRGADVVALATHAAQPVIEPEWIAPGTHVSSVGYRPPDGELPRALTHGRLFVETREAFEPTPVGCAELQGLDPHTATELGEVLLGTAAGPPRRRRDHRLQGDGPRRRGHRRRRARLRRGRRPRHVGHALARSLAMNLSSPALAVPPTLARRNGVQPSSRPLVPSAWRDHFQKLNSSTWSMISPSVTDDPRVDVVDHRPAGGGERVAGDPVRGLRVVLGQLDLQVAGGAGEHAPHRAGLGAGQVTEHGVAEMAVRRVQGGHRLPVAAVERGVQTLHYIGAHGLSLPDRGAQCFPLDARAGPLIRAAVERPWTLLGYADPSSQQEFVAEDHSRRQAHDLPVRAVEHGPRGHPGRITPGRRAGRPRGCRPRPR